MFCKKCGQEITGNEKFCGYCGYPVEETNQQPSGLSESNYNYQAPVKSANYTTQLVCGILASVLSGLNYIGIPFVHIIGIVLGAVVISKVKQDKAAGKNYSNTGYVTGIIGLILGIIAVVFGVFFNLQQL